MDYNTPQSILPGGYPEEMVDALTAIRPGELTLMVPDDASAEKLRHRVMEIAMSLGLRYEWNIVKTSYAPMLWNIVVRRVSAIDTNRLSYIAVRLQDIDNPQSVARFFRSRLFNVLDREPELIEYYRPKEDGSDYLSFFPSPVPCDASPDYPSSFTDSNEFEESAPDEKTPGFGFPHPCLRKRARSIGAPAVRPPDPEIGIEEALEDEKKRWVDALSALMVQYVARFHEAPPMEMIEQQIRGKILINASRKSPITVSGDMKIYLPELNEIQLRMTPLATTVYIFFLCHPEGIRLKDIADHKHQLLEIYSMVKPGSSDRLALRSINELINPLGNSLQEKLSMTRRAIKRYILDPEMAKNYIITGERGGLYRIPLDPQLITLPQILRN